MNFFWDIWTPQNPLKIRPINGPKNAHIGPLGLATWVGHLGRYEACQAISGGHAKWLIPGSVYVCFWGGFTGFVVSVLKIPELWSKIVQ